MLPTTLAAAALLAFAGDQRVSEAVLYVLCLILCVSVHEFGHAFVADRLGDPLPRAQGRVTLNPLAHIDLLGTVIFPAMMAMGVGIPLGWGKPVQWSAHPRYLTRRFTMRTIKLMVSVAGPAMNLLLALLLSGVFLVMVHLGPWSQGFGGRIVLNLVILNLQLMFFNLLPIPPLDGRSFLEFLPDSLAPVRDTLMKYGSLIFLALVLIGPIAGGISPLRIIMSPFHAIINWYTDLLIALA